MCSTDNTASSVTADHWAVITNCVDANSSWQMGDKTSQLSSSWKCICTAFPLAREAWCSQACWAVAPVPPDVAELPPGLAGQVACKAAFIQKPWMALLAAGLPQSNLLQSPGPIMLHALTALETTDCGSHMATQACLKGPIDICQPTCLSTCAWPHPATASASHWHVTDT